jgi:hypothetical protein
MTRLALTLALAAFATSTMAATQTGGSKIDPKAQLEIAFANTLVSTYPDGRQSRMWLNRDGTYRYQGRKKEMTDGHWTLRGNRVCMRQSHPVAIPFSYCTQVHAGGVGTSWDGKALTGEKIKITVEPGR